MINVITSRQRKIDKFNQMIGTDALYYPDDEKYIGYIILPNLF